jgi:type IV pilus assembly protein PilC
MTGTIEAASAEQAQASLREIGLEITELEQVKNASMPGAVGRSEFMLFNEQLASLTKVGIPLERGLRELAADAGSARMKKLINGIADDLEQGVPIDRAVEKHRSHFPPLYGLILKAGVETGRLSEMLASLNRHLQIEHRTRRIVYEAMTYPAVVLFLAAVLISAVFVMVIPGFKDVLMDMSDGKAGLPALTTAVLIASEHVWSFWIGAGVVTGAIVFAWVSLGASPSGRRAKERLLMSIPLLGRVYTNGLISRFAEILTVTVNAGCTMETAFDLAGESSGSERLKKDCTTMASGLRQGFNVLESGMNCVVVPRLFLYSVQLGSQRNELKENLQSLREMYAAKTYSLQSQLQAILLPVLIIFLGGLIGLIVLAMFLPMVRMVQVLM